MGHLGYKQMTCDGSMSIADPGLPKGQPEKGGINLLFDIAFAENCMKSKKIGPRESARL